MNYADQQKSPGRNIAGFIAVVLFHVVLIYALVSGLGYNIVQKLAAPIETKIVKNPDKPPPPPPPPPPPDQAAPPPPPVIPIPEVQIQPTAAPTNAIQVVQRSNTKPVAAPPRPAVADRAFSARNLSSCKPETPEDYEDRTGRVVVDCTIDQSGHPGGCRVLSTAGGSAFASSVMTWLDSGCVRFNPAIRNGQPVSEEHQWAVTFQPED